MNIKFTLKGITFCFLVAFLLSCASADISKAVRVGTVDGDVDYRISGSFNQEDNPGKMLELFTRIPLKNLNRDVPVELLLHKIGVGSNASMEFDRVKGDFVVEILGTGNQNSSSVEIKSATNHINIGPLQSEIGDDK